MKVSCYITALLIAPFIAVQAQEEQSLRQQPPAVTHSQVVQDARMAKLMRTEDESRRDSRNNEATRKEHEKNDPTVTQTGNTSTDKTSTKPGKQ